MDSYDWLFSRDFSLTVDITNIPLKFNFSLFAKLTEAMNHQFSFTNQKVFRFKLRKM